MRGLRRLVRRVFEFLDEMATAWFEGIDLL